MLSQLVVLWDLLGSRLTQRTVKGRLERGRSSIADFGWPCDPVGQKDAKTQCCGTYRTAGRTCPSSCPMLAFRTNKDGSTSKRQKCYALNYGPVSLASKRAENTWQSGVAAAMLAIVAQKKGLVRLHVSGDIMRPDDNSVVDHHYVGGLMDLGAVARGSRDRLLGWSYSQAEDLPLYKGDLLQFGWAFCQSSSEYGNPGGADTFVASSKEEIIAAGGVVCPQQLGKVKSCAECGKGLRINLCAMRAMGLFKKPIGFIEH